MSTENTNMNDEQGSNQTNTSAAKSSICLRKSTRERLRGLKQHPDETWDTLANELAECFEKHELGVDGDV